MNKIQIRGIIPGFKSNTYLNAFILSSFILALTTVSALYLHDYLYKISYDIINKQLKKKNNSLNKSSLLNNIIRIFILFMVTFLIGLMCYIIMFYLFGFGSGMLIDMSTKDYNKMIKTTILKPIIK